MRRVFADSYYWVALLNDKDQGHEAAQEASEGLQGTVLVTTDEVLIEVLAFFAERGSHLRTVAAAFTRSILESSDVEVRPQTHPSFLDGLALYGTRPDKGYSLTDCISMLTMRREGIVEVLTHDSHFAQEGFAPLL